MKEKQVLTKALMLSRMQTFLDLWRRTKDIQYYYEYQKYFKQLKNEIDR